MSSTTTLAQFFNGRFSDRREFCQIVEYCGVDPNTISYVHAFHTTRLNQYAGYFQTLKTFWLGISRIRENFNEIDHPEAKKIVSILDIYLQCHNQVPLGSCLELKKNTYFHEGLIHSVEAIKGELREFFTVNIAALLYLFNLEIVNDPTSTYIWLDKKELFVESLLQS